MSKHEPSALEYSAPESPYRVAYDGGFSVREASTVPPADEGDPEAMEEAREAELGTIVEEIADLQRRLYARDQYAVLLVFQAMDGAGKDSTIRAVTTGVSPAGFQVSSFKAPSADELDQDFLWRTSVRLPQRGRIGVFNRSHYEEVLVVRVHPEFLDAQRLPRVPDLPALWEERYRSIREHELHLARNGTVVLKFWLNISKDEQARRFIRRIDKPDKNWKFSGRDVAERGHWDRYMEAYEDALRATSRPWAPWYAIPADDKPWMRLTVAKIIRDQLSALGLEYPTLPDANLAELAEYRRALAAELSGD